MLKTALISHPDTLLHVMDGSHPESPARISVILQKIKESGLHSQLAHYSAPLATDAQLQRVHHPKYVKYIRDIAPKAGKVKLDADTAMGPMSLSAALHASGAVVLATDLVMQKKVANAFCAVRPPGHHAGIAHSAGFCIFNGVAVGVAHAIAAYGVERVAIIDFDVHHGDGTEEIFKDNPKVMLCSTFQHPFYPHRGAESRTERMINVPLAAKTGSLTLRKAFETEFLPALQRFKPQIVFISAGFDAHENDPLADLKLVKDDYVWMTEFCKKIAAQYAENRIISVLEGGYQLTDLAESAEVHVRALAGLT